MNHINIEIQNQKNIYIYMQNIIRKYKNNEISMDNYIENVAHYYKLYMIYMTYYVKYKYKTKYNKYKILFGPG